jgi:Ca2+-binding EF-hand superfamily protein
MSDENIKIAFDLFDTDGSGTIDVNEFYHLITDCEAEKKVEHTKNYQKMDCFEDHLHQNHIDDKKWTNILNEIDVNGDGFIDFEEFKKGIHAFIDGSFN